jgi:hypothetical protein
VPELRPGPSFYGVVLGATVLTFLVHESAHWAMGQALGYEMRMSLNGAAPKGGFRDAADAAWVTAAGPAITGLQAVMAYALVRGRNLSWAYAFLFVAWFMRFAAAVVSLLNPNDEARLSLAWGWGQWLLPALVVLALLVLTALASRHLRLGWGTNAKCYLLCSAAFGLIVFLDARLVA